MKKEVEISTTFSSFNEIEEFSNKTILDSKKILESYGDVPVKIKHNGWGEVFRNLKLSENKESSLYALFSLPIFEEKTLKNNELHVVGKSGKVIIKMRLKE